MDKNEVIDLLERNGKVLFDLLEGAGPKFAAWKPSAGGWSPLEVACHLLDEEREDFRSRIRLTLEDPRKDWPGIDPERWVTERSYAGRELGEVIEELRRERASSVAWLRSTPLDLDVAHAHPQLGRLRVGDLLASWAAHDLLHLRQLTRLQYQWLEELAKPHSVVYAGRW
ncbi:MAG: DinB family protein [Thermoanaerobaculia bacterium]|nr:DinB family protein [Thermoanaerobaculia bacterium]